MKINCDWFDDEQTILLVQALAPWDWNDVEQALAEQLQHIRSVTHNVYSIYDLTLSPALPNGLVIPRLKHVASDRLDNQRLTIYVGMGFLQQQMMDLTRNAFHLDALFANFRFVRTLDEALRVIDAHKHDSKGAV